MVAFKKILLIATTFFLISCKAQMPKDLIGDYLSVDCNFYNKYIDGYGIKGAVTLHLGKDSTFSYKTCNEVMTGKWHVKNRSIILNCRERKQRKFSTKESDAPNYTLLDCGTTPIIIFMENGKIFERTVLNKKPRRICYKKQI